MCASWPSNSAPTHCSRHPMSSQRARPPQPTPRPGGPGAGKPACEEAPPHPRLHRGVHARVGVGHQTRVGGSPAGGLPAPRRRSPGRRGGRSPTRRAGVQRGQSVDRRGQPDDVAGGTRGRGAPDAVDPALRHLYPRLDGWTRIARASAVGQRRRTEEVQDVGSPEDVEPPEPRGRVEWQATRSGPTTSDAARAWTPKQSGSSASARTPRHRVAAPPTGGDQPADLPLAVRLPRLRRGEDAALVRRSPGRARSPPGQARGERPAGGPCRGHLWTRRPGQAIMELRWRHAAARRRVATPAP